MIESAEKIAVRTLVKNKIIGRKGVVVEDLWGVCGPGEIPVVYNGETSFRGTDIEDLKVIGPENAKADPKKCGAGEEACIFFVIGADGFECQRFGPLRNSIILRKEKMRAKRAPTELYPYCQAEWILIADAIRLSSGR